MKPQTLINAVLTAATAGFFAMYMKNKNTITPNQWQNRFIEYCYDIESYEKAIKDFEELIAWGMSPATSYDLVVSNIHD